MDSFENITLDDGSKNFPESDSKTVPSEII